MKASIPISLAVAFCCTTFTDDAHGQWSLNGTRVFYVAGNVGIGTSNPVFTLDVRSPGQRAIYGVANSATGVTFGVFGQSNSTSGRGIIGLAAATTGVNIGVFGQSSSPTGVGVYGLGVTTTGINYGVYGRTNSPDGYAGFFVGNLAVNGWIGSKAPIPVDLYSGNQRVFRAIYASSGGTITPNIIGGHAANGVTDGMIGATIAGGGSQTEPNGVTGSYGTVAGGYSNLANQNAAVGGGIANEANGIGATVAGGNFNKAIAALSLVGGGFLNYNEGTYATIGGGQENYTSGSHATVAGGGSNRATDNYSTVGGGMGNIAGNDNPDIEDATHATIAGGLDNIASAQASTVAGGNLNVAIGAYSAIPGGLQNAALGMNSFASGRRAQAIHDGAFVWGDSTDANIASSAANQFIARASGGVQFMDAAGVGVELMAGGNSWSALSDRNLKTNITPIDHRDILNKLVAMPVTRWNLISQNESVQHIGPMAQDFYTSFGVGEDERRISQTDADGIMMAAIQGLHQMVEQLASQSQAADDELVQTIAHLEAENVHLTQRLDYLEGVIAELVAAVSNK